MNTYTKESQWHKPDKPAEPVSNSGPEQVQCSHLLVKHEHSRRPSSWREDKITRSKAEAEELIKGKIKTKKTLKQTQILNQNIIV